MVWRFSLFSTFNGIPGIFIISWPVSDVYKITQSVQLHILISHFSHIPRRPLPPHRALPWLWAPAMGKCTCLILLFPVLRWTEGTGGTAVLGSASLLWRDTAAFTWARPGLLVPHNLYWWHDLHVDDMSGFPVDNVLLYASSSITSTSSGRLRPVSLSLW